jgi:hypothetical protein
VQIASGGLQSASHKQHEINNFQLKSVDKIKLRHDLVIRGNKMVVKRTTPLHARQEILG